jgi:DNA-binding GntR family transcriptional regulator
MATKVQTGREAAYEAVRARITTLELSPGTALSENDLAATLAMSRTPVREALILLAAEGLVQVFAKVGSFVARIDPARVEQAQFVREAIEVASLADLHAPDPAALAEVEATLHAQESPTITHDAFFHLDEEFHRGLLRMAGREGAWPTVHSAKGHLDRVRMLGLHRQRSIAELAAEHRKILEAATAGQTTTAVDLLRRHLRHVLDDLDAIRQQSPDLFTTDPLAVPVRKSVAVWE